AIARASRRPVGCVAGSGEGVVAGTRGGVRGARHRLYDPRGIVARCAAGVGASRLGTSAIGLSLGPAGRAARTPGARPPITFGAGPVSWPAAARGGPTCARGIRAAPVG